MSLLPRPSPPVPRRLACGTAALLFVVAFLAGCGAKQISRHPSSPVASNALFPTASAECPAHLSLHADAPINVGEGAGALAADSGGVWVARTAAGTITRITGMRRRVLSASGSPVSLALGDGKLWVALRDADRVLLVNTQTLSRTRGAIVSVPVKVIVQHSSAWVLSLDAGALYPLNGSSGSAGEPIYAPVANPIDAASAGGEVWLLGARESGLSPVNAGLGRIVRSGFDMRGRVLTGLSSSGSTLWLAEPVRRALLRVRASTVAVSELPAPRGMRPVATAVGSCGVWVGGQHGMLALINPQTGAVLGPPLQAGRSIAALAPSGAGVWLSDPRDGTVRYVQPQPAA